MNFILNRPLYTSSTTQGGGGSFKNRKPIGEFGCCESRLAERIHWWTERWLRSPLFLSLSLSIYLSIYLFIYLSIFLSIYLSARSKTKKFCETSVMFEHKNVQNGTILRDVFIFWAWPHPKRSNSARLPHFSKCKTSKTKNSARLPSKMESWVQSWQTRTNAFCDFSSPPV